MIKFFFALLPAGAIGDYLFHGAIYIQGLRFMFLDGMDRFAGFLLPT